MASLNDLLSLICERTCFHVCVHDISGLLDGDDLQIDAKYEIHSKPFCDAAKSSRIGYDVCISCKDASNRRAVSGESFSRVCPYGIREVIRPVAVNGRVRCIVYLGNICEDRAALAETAAREAAVTGADAAALAEAVSGAELISDRAYCDRLADFIADFICSLAKDNPSEPAPAGHWCVRRVCEYVNENYSEAMTLSSLSKLYFINPKYLGRIFKLQTGMSFHQYLNSVRLRKSLELIRSGNMQIIDIAAECGFRNVTYFNRVFKQAYGGEPPLVMARLLRGSGAAAKRGQEAPECEKTQAPASDGAAR